MKDSISESGAHQERKGTEPQRKKSRPGAGISFLTPLDPIRQANRLPIRILKMLTAHTSHLLHPEYLQPLTSAPVSIELDAKKSPLALLAQTCSQIGKPDPPSSSKLGSVSSIGQGDKDSHARSSSLKLGEHRPSPEDKSSFKPYNKVGVDSRRDSVAASSSSGSDKAGFRIPANAASANCQQPFPPLAISPGSRAASATPPRHAQQTPPPHRRSQSPGGQQGAHSQPAHGETTREQASPSSIASGGHLKKDADAGKANMDSPRLANSSHARASANSSNGSCESSSNHDGGKERDSQPSHVAPISPYKPGHSLFPLPPSSATGYHGSVVGAYAGYPSQFTPGLDPSKSSLSMGGMGVSGKLPSSSPLTGASPPSFMQGLCRDPYCLSYHLGGSNCNSCLHDPSSSPLKAGYPLVYPAHPLHHLHAGSSSPSLPHPLYAYGFVLPDGPMPHACNWVSAAGPCDKRFAAPDELLAHLRTHTAPPGGGLDAKMLSGISPSGPGSCHLHLPHHQAGLGSMHGSFSLRAPPSLGLARYHPYSKVHLPPGPASMPLHSLATSSPYYSPYALYSQRLGSASALGYQ